MIVELVVGDAGAPDGGTMLPAGGAADAVAWTLAPVTFVVPAAPPPSTLPSSRAGAAGALASGTAGGVRAAGAT
jgi:hypothetical protein